MNVTLTPATDADLSGILDIVNHAILNTTAIYDYEPRTLVMQKEWFDEKKSCGFPVIVAKDGENVLGFGAYGTFRQKAGYRFTVEHSVYVADGHNGKGIGSLLLSALIALAKAQDLHVMIGGIDASNAGSIAFHKKFGFTENGHFPEVGYKFGKWLDLQLMQLILK